MQNNYRYRFRDRDFVRKLFVLALPIMLQELMNSSVNMIDTFMIGRLGPEEVTAVGLSNQIFFLFSVIIFGINSGASIFIGQFWGKEDVRGVHKIMGIVFTVSAFITILFFCGARFFPQQIMSIISNDQNVIDLGCTYLGIVCYSYIFTAIIQCINTSLKSTGNAGVPMICTMFSLVTNAVLNYILIFRFNMGVAGAAFATLTARTVEVFIQLVLVIALKKPIATIRIKEYFAVEKGFLPGYFKVTVPVLCNEFLWALGMYVYNIAYKYSGTTAQAAVQIASVVQNLAIVIGLGMGLSCGIMISNAIGAGDKHIALDYSRRCPVIATGFCIASGIILSLFAKDISMLFKISSEARLCVQYMIYVVAVGTVFKTLNYIYIIGVLRNGGDTKFCLLLDAGSVWLLGVPAAFLGSAVLGLPIYVTFALVYVEELIKSFLARSRVRKNKWINSLV